MSTPDAQDASPSPEHSGDEDGDDMAEDKQLKSEPEDESSQSQPVNGSKTNLKDPNRQKRKKARRACLACQRAHLTCSDERPCGRCIRRGLQDQCQDGVRKKAKYLHDAPNEALLPPHLSNYPPHMNSQSSPNNPSGTSLTDQGLPMGPQPTYFSPTQPPNNYGMFPQNGPPMHSNMPPPGPDMGPYSGQSTPISPPHYTQQSGQRTPPVQSMGQPMQQVPQQSPPQMQNFGPSMFDTNDPSLFNFDLAGMNFGNHYGALEFGMLGHMSSGAGETPPHENNIISPLNQAMYHANNPQSYADSPVNVGGFDNVDWQIAHSRQGSQVNMQTPQSAIPNNMDSVVRPDTYHNAYSVGHNAGSLSSASPGSSGQDGTPTTYEGAPASPAFFVNTNQQQAQHQPIYQNRPIVQSQQSQQHQRQPGSLLRNMNPNFGPKRVHRDTNVIYRDLNKPYPYTQAFHRFQELLHTRFPVDKRMRVAKSMASIRPSFIACTKDLDEQDLIAQERTFQRKLWGYEDWLAYIGTPSLVIRRSGEVAAVGKEFSLLTGWSRNVLLGLEPNLNSNWDSISTQTSSRGSIAGATTPAEDLPPRTSTGNPVMIAELLDHDSVVRFYEDFARLAFGDARGTAARRVKLMSYVARNEDDGLMSSVSNGVNQAKKDDLGGRVVDEKMRPARRAGGKDRIDCQMCWCVWHDQFDMPAMIILNFLPIIQQHSPQESFKQPVQLGAQRQHIVA
ncbi:hypothetical protein EJ05DRAFT_498214 [Pseudovirgaria hyperparasitica]|uniref:Zn(2)-C6 fungal-type domain-containing protein n=1 Tax=Pseudovirgaria hyperparasitica TaxID=470096 RepID=A0A6A6WF89_9PEZI|nr:uncharacterized protein EJ05DRAFT_498214 [Pseudovirgaria hyperparasitica]KAF2760247.1 hypothetical protein EJ05DRAFT_498214 [Pseudovirgaria hyperparasitica]